MVDSSCLNVSWILSSSFRIYIYTWMRYLVDYYLMYLMFNYEWCLVCSALGWSLRHCLSGHHQLKVTILEQKFHIGRWLFNLATWLKLGQFIDDVCRCTYFLHGDFPIFSHGNCSINQVLAMVNLIRYLSGMVNQRPQPCRASMFSFTALSMVKMMMTEIPGSQWLINWSSF